MPPSRSQGRGSYSREATFVDISLSDKESEALKKALFSQSEWYRAFDQMCDAGLRVTIKEDARNHSIMAMVQAAEYNQDEDLIIFVLRAGTAAAALLKLAYYWVSHEGTLPDHTAMKGPNYDEDDLFK